MMEYYFHLVGLQVVLKTPALVQISESLRPFACDPFAGEADCTIRLLSGPLPCATQNGYWHGPAYYETTGEYRRIFHCKTLLSPPFAVTTMEPKGDIQITVHPDYFGCYSGTSGIFNCIGFENLLLQHRGLLLHASLIEYAWQGIAFTGPSGVGKSTQAELWQRCLGAKILNGDRAALRNTQTGWVAYGSPYAGTSGIYCNENAPLAAIVVLRQGQENKLHRLSGAKAMACLWPEFSVRRQDMDFVERAMALCEQLLDCVPVYLLECLPDESAVTLLKEGLSL